VRDKKMLEKLATHDLQNVFVLFNLVDKCARAAEGHDWHLQPAPEAGKADKPNVDAVTQGSGENNKKKKASGKDKPLVGAPTTVATTAGGGHGSHGDKRPCQPSVSDDGGQRCPVHNSKRYNTEECWEIKKLAEQIHEQKKHEDGASSCQ
jgi:hypothetical protein